MILSVRFDDKLQTRVFQLRKGDVVASSVSISATVDGTTVELTSHVNSTSRGGRVAFYVDGTLRQTVDWIGRDITRTISNLSNGTHSCSCVFYGDDVVSSTTREFNIGSSGVNVTINVPLSLVYSDAFNITGVLTDGNDNPLSSQTVGLYVGSTLTNTTTTNSDGEYSFTHTPVTTGNHTFKVVYDGTSNIVGSESSTVSRTVGVETSVLNVTSPINNSQHYTGDNVTFSGTLLSDDGEAISGATITIYDNGSSGGDVLGASLNSIGTATTDSEGSFSTSISASNIGSGNVSLTISYAGDTYYDSSTASRSVTIGSHNYTFDITGTGSLVGKNGSTTSSVVTGTLKDNDVSVSGETISVVVKDSNDNVLDTDTITTDSNGQASYTYTANSEGEVTIYMECMSLQETYTIEDVAYYDSMLQSNNDWVTSVGSVSPSYSSNGCDIRGATSNTANEYDLNYTPSGNYQLECTISGVYVDTSSYNATAMIIVAGVKAGWTANGSNLNVWDNRSHDIAYSNFSTPMPCKFVVEGTSVKLYLNNVLINTYTIQSDTIGVEAYNARGITLKDLKITDL